MNLEDNKNEGRLLSKLLLIKSDLQGVNKNYLDKESSVLLEGIDTRIEILIKNLINKKK